MDIRYPFLIKDYGMTLKTFTQTKNMVIEHGARWLLNLSGTDVKKGVQYKVTIYKFDQKSQSYEPYDTVRGIRTDTHIEFHSSKFNEKMTLKQAKEFLYGH